MIRHYLTFQRQAELLQENLCGYLFRACWSQEKERIYIEFSNGQESRFAEISLNLRFGYALPLDEVHRARRNTLDLFQKLSGATLRNVSMHDQERVIRFSFGRGEALQVFFYGKGSGNVLRTREGRVLDSFTAVGEEYDRVLSGVEEEPIGRDVLIERISTSETSLQQALVASLRTLGKPLVAEALWRVGFPPEKLAAEFSTEELGALLGQVDSVYSNAATSNQFRLYHTEKDVIFSLIQLEHLEESGEVEQVEEFDDLPRAIRICRSSWFRKKEFSRLHGMLKAGFDREERKTLRSLEHAEDSIAHIGRATEWEGVGNLLLANFYQLKRGDKEVLLTDWEGVERSIKLDPKLTPAENADRYFRKARGARKEAEHSSKRAEELRARRDTLREGRSRVDTANEIEELEKIRTEYGALIGMKVREKEERREERFRRFVVEGGFEVFAGKSAANNDELTLRFARPNDIWLHARGSSGSHVVLRWSEVDGRPPKRTLEEAAMIAAFYSGAKHSKLVPVAWTRKKYVRKPKGAAPGAVLVNREEVVMVEPRLPENRSDSTSDS